MSLQDIACTTLDDAKAELTANDASLDAMADLVLQRVAKFFGECAGDDSFCAISVDEKRDQNGKLQYLMMVPCDDAAGTPVRRYEREMKKVVVQ